MLLGRRRGRVRGELAKGGWALPEPHHVPLSRWLPLAFYRNATAYSRTREHESIDMLPKKRACTTSVAAPRAPLPHNQPQLWRPFGRSARRLQLKLWLELGLGLHRGPYKRFSRRGLRRGRTGNVRRGGAGETYAAIGPCRSVRNSGSLTLRFVGERRRTTVGERHMLRAPETSLGRRTSKCERRGTRIWHEGRCCADALGESGRGNGEVARD